MSLKDGFRVINQKFLDGDGIDDDELSLLIKFYERVEIDLRILGSHFHLPWKETFHRLDKLRQFKQARKEKY